MTDHDVPPGDLPRQRRGAHEFLRQRAALARAFQHDGDRWEMTPRPDAAALPERGRYRAHARLEARPLAMAQLYDLDPGITARAVCLDDAIHESGTARPTRGPAIPMSRRRWVSSLRRGQGSSAGGMASAATLWVPRSWPATGHRGDHPVPVPQGWRCRAIDRILVSKPWKDAIVPGSFQVHQPADPARPDSGHLRVSVAAGV